MNSKRNTNKTVVRKQRKNNKQVKNGNQTVHGFETGSQNLMIMPKKQLIVNDSEFVCFRYTDYSAETIPATGQVFNRRFRPSAAYDIDPLLGNTSMPGFAEWSSFFQNYLVTVSKCLVRVTPGGASAPELITLLPTQLDLGSSPTLATVTSLPDQSYATTKLLGGLGSPTLTLKSSFSTKKVFGSDRVYNDNDYASSVTSVPTLNWYWNISGLSPSPVAAASTIYMETIIDIGVVFFNRKNLPN